MSRTIFLIVSVWLCTTQADAGECETGWTAFNNEACVKSFTSFLTYPEARMFCTTQGNSVSTAALVTIKTANMQQFIADFSNNSFDNFWLGGKYDDDTAQFQWEDGEPLLYTNWGEGYPRDNPNSDVCIQLRPRNAKASNDVAGKWEDTNCQRRNLALCQRSIVWSLEDATREILSIRKELQDTKLDLAGTKTDLEATKTDLQTVNSRIVPVGSIYIEYYGQPDPGTLWPSLTWEDITDTYAGMFFRAYGGNSSEWGTTQRECVPRLSEVQYLENQVQSHNVLLPENGWSGWAKTGYNHCCMTPYPGNYEGVRYNIAGCEVRPTNQAIRIWKRIL